MSTDTDPTPSDLEKMAGSWERTADALQGEVDRGECIRQSAESKRSRVQVLRSNASQLREAVAAMSVPALDADHEFGDILHALADMGINMEWVDDDHLRSVVDDHAIAVARREQRAWERAITEFADASEQLQTGEEAKGLTTMPAMMAIYTTSLRTLVAKGPSREADDVERQKECTCRQCPRHGKHPLSRFERERSGDWRDRLDDDGRPTCGPARSEGGCHHCAGALDAKPGVGQYGCPWCIARYPEAKDVTPLPAARERPVFMPAAGRVIEVEYEPRCQHDWGPGMPWPCVLCP